MASRIAAIYSSRLHDYIERTLPMTVKPDIKTSETSEIASTTRGSAVRSMRESFGYSLDDLAVTCGLTTIDIARIESGEETDETLLRRIANALNLPEEALTGESPSE
ncbi:helix-turn-helix domain-containing protein [Flavimaribacter sediminis]|nr:helix-turn-helix transcriptional regulator [Flavimaribacter sediminis]